MTKEIPPGPPPLLNPTENGQVSTGNANTEQTLSFSHIGVVGAFLLAFFLILRPCRRYITRRMRNANSTEQYRRYEIAGLSTSHHAGFSMVASNNRNRSHNKYRDTLPILFGNTSSNFEFTFGSVVVLETIPENSIYQPTTTSNINLRKRKAVEVPSSGIVYKNPPPPLPPPRLVPYGASLLRRRSKFPPVPRDAVPITMFVCECCPKTPKKFETEERLK